jgi:hypothetical protein
MCLCNHKWSARNEEKVVVESARTVQQEINTTQTPKVCRSIQPKISDKWFKYFTEHVTIFAVSRWRRNTEWGCSRIRSRKAYFGLRGRAERDWKKLHSEEIHDLHSLPNTLRVIKSRRMRWTDGYVASMGKIKSCIHNFGGETWGEVATWKAQA